MKSFILFFLTLFLGSFSYAQVGVNATTIHSSAALDIQYGTTPKGLLTPRMETALRIAIETPADGLIVYDTDLKSFFHYQKGTTPSWVRMSSDVSGRTNFKRIKSGDNLAIVLKEELGTGSKYVLKANTLYEINGTVTFNFPIDLNNAYIQGIDSGEDKIVAAGNIFDGSTGGTVKGLTLVSTGGKVFNLSGLATKDQNLIIRDGIIANSSSVGTIENFDMVFMSIIQFAGNTNGITYSTINRLLLSNLGWFGDNTGTFETLKGVIKLVQIDGGFSEVNGTTIGLDVNAADLAVATGTLQGRFFTGSSPNGAGYVNGYNILNIDKSSPDYKFSNAWTVDSPGIAREGDSQATGTIYFDTGYDAGSLITTFPLGKTGTDSRIIVNAITQSSHLFRFTAGNNRITYTGNKTRYFHVAGSVSLQPEADDLVVILYITKNDTVLPETRVFGRGASGHKTTNGGTLALPILGTVQLKKGEWIEVWAERSSGSGNFTTASLSLTAL